MPFYYYVRSSSNFNVPNNVLPTGMHVDAAASPWLGLAAVQQGHRRLPGGPPCGERTEFPKLHADRETKPGWTHETAECLHACQVPLCERLHTRLITHMAAQPTEKAWQVL